MLSEVWKHERRLMLAAAALFALSILLVGGMIFDDVTILGVNRWLKPFKFAVSTAIYIATIAFYLHVIEGKERSKAVIRNGSILLMAGEIFCVVMQSFRGVRSHFNITTPFDGIVFALMGLMILVSTLLVLYLFIVMLRAQVKTSPVIWFSLKLGLAVFLAASVQGGYMSQHMSHAVGIPDGGAGLPLVNWSTEGGDLRIAHFFGLHALQAIPLFAYFAERSAPVQARLLTAAFGIFYFGIFTATFINALLGRPLW